MFEWLIAGHVDSLAMPAMCTTAEAPSVASSTAARSVMSATTCSSPGRTSVAGTTSRHRIAQPRSGSPPRSTVPIRPAAPVSRTGPLTMSPRSRGALRSSLVPRCDAHAPLRSRKSPDELDHELPQPARGVLARRQDLLVVQLLAGDAVRGVGDHREPEDLQAGCPGCDRLE